MVSRRLPRPEDRRDLDGEPESLGGDTVDDLLRVAANRRAKVPTLLVLTILVQLLKALRDQHERGRVHGAVSPRNLVLAGRRAEALFEDPSRDPCLELRCRALDAAFQAPEIGSGGRPTPASDVYGAGAVVRILLAGRTAGGLPDRGGLPRPGSVGPLVEGLTHPRPEARWGISKALEVARIRALELFEEWDRSRHADRLREALDAALEARHTARVQDLLPALAEAAPEDPLVETSRRWLAGRTRREAELRHRLTRAIYLGNVREAAWREQQLCYFLAERAASDGDLDIARRWLSEQAQAEEERWEGAKRSWLKLLLTALPLAFAVGLIALLVGVLIWE